MKEENWMNIILEILSLLGYCYYKLGNWEEAIKIEKYVIEQSPYYPQANYYLALAYEKSPKYRNKAMEQMKLALEYTNSLISSSGPLQQKKLTELSEEIDHRLKGLH